MPQPTSDSGDAKSPKPAHFALTLDVTQAVGDVDSYQRTCLRRPNASFYFGGTQTVMGDFQPSNIGGLGLMVWIMVRVTA